MAAEQKLLTKLVFASWMIAQIPSAVSTADAQTCDDQSHVGGHNSTTWVVQPSFKYDVLTFLNTLTGDSFYLDYYDAQYAYFDTLLTADSREALASLKRKIKDESGNIVSAFLTLYYSATDDESLDEMVETLDDSREMQTRLRATPYYSDEGWALFESVKSELKIIFEFLREIEFRSYWQDKIRPRVLERIAAVEPRLLSFNVVCEIESVTGRQLPSDTITVYLLFFSQPHGIRITGTRFLSDVAWPFSIVIRNAIHEMMHPPYDLAADSPLREIIGLLKKDAFLMDRVENHDPSFGYNSFEGFVEEDVVQALEQIINERLGIAREARQRWRENDDGMHVLAVALYKVMQDEGFSTNGEQLRAFLMRQIETGALQPGGLEKIYFVFYENDEH